MSVLLTNETITTNKPVSQRSSRTTVECDVIVSDTKPDILKVLEVSGFISVSEKSFSNGKAYISGTVYMNVLYTPEDAESCPIKNLSTSQPFTHIIDMVTLDTPATLMLDLKPESFNYSLINSRKINLRCSICFDASLIAPESITVATQCEDDLNLCVSTEKLRLCDSCLNSEHRVVKSEKLELPLGNPSINEVLRTSVYPESTELTLSEGSALAKGQLKLCILYSSLNDNSFQTVEYTIPFEETLDVANAEEDMEAEIEYSLSTLNIDIGDDSDGEPRVLHIDIGLLAALHAFKIYEPSIISDAYSYCGEAKISYTPVKLEQLIGITTAKLTHKATVSIPENMPPLQKICDICVSASVERIIADNNEVTVFGTVKSKILYASDNKDTPVSMYEASSEYSHTLSSAAFDIDALCDASVFTEHMSYVINSPTSVDLRIILGLCVRSVKNCEVNTVSEIEIIPDTCIKKRPYIRMVFVKPGDTLWGLAKKYKTSVDKIKECNNLKSDTIYAGTLLKIC